MLQYLLHSQALKTLPLLPKAFYRVIFCLLSKGLASAFLSLCLPYSCLLLAPSPAKLALAAAHLPATTPQKHSAPFPRKSSSFSSAFISCFTSTEGEKRHYKPTNFLHSHVCKGPSPTTVHRGQTPWVVSCQEGKYCLQGSSSVSHQPLLN